MAKLTQQEKTKLFAALTEAMDDFIDKNLDDGQIVITSETAAIMATAALAVINAIDETIEAIE